MTSSSGSTEKFILFRGEVVTDRLLGLFTINVVSCGSSYQTISQLEMQQKEGLEAYFRTVQVKVVQVFQVGF